MLMAAIQGVLNSLDFEVIAGFYGVNIFNASALITAIIPDF
jgi:hypothetical protein